MRPPVKVLLLHSLPGDIPEVKGRPDTAAEAPAHIYLHFKVSEIYVK